MDDLISVKSPLTVDPIKLELGFDLVPLVRPDLGGTLVERIGHLREEIRINIGIVLPPIRLCDSFEIEGNQCAIFIKGVKISQVSIDCVTNSLRLTSEVSNITRIIIHHLRETFLEHASELMDYDQINLLLEQNSVTFPHLISEWNRIFPNKSSLLRTLKYLLKEGLSIRKLPIILELLIEDGRERPADETMHLIRSRSVDFS